MSGRRAWRAGVHERAETSEIACLWPSLESSLSYAFTDRTHRHHSQHTGMGHATHTTPKIVMLPLSIVILSEKMVLFEKVPVEKRGP